MKEVIGSKSFDKYFNQTTEDGKKLLVLFYHSKWCNQHRDHEIHLRGSLEDCNEKVLMIDTMKEENKTICSSFKIDIVPSLIVIKRRKIKKKIIGYNHDKIEEFFSGNDKKEIKQKSESKEKKERKHSKHHRTKKEIEETKPRKHREHREHHKNHKENHQQEHPKREVIKEPERNIDREIDEKKKELRRRKKELKKEIKKKRVDVTLSESDEAFKKFNYSSDSSD